MPPKKPPPKPKRKVSPRSPRKLRSLEPENMTKDEIKLEIERVGEEIEELNKLVEDLEEKTSIRADKVLEVKESGKFIDELNEGVDRIHEFKKEVIQSIPEGLSKTLLLYSKLAKDLGNDFCSNFCTNMSKLEKVAKDKTIISLESQQAEANEKLEPLKTRKYMLEAALEKWNIEE